MRRAIKYIGTSLAMLTITIGLMRGGDFFLAFVGKKIHVNFDYKNHSGFVSCFLLRFIELDNPVFKLKDFDLAVGCRKAFIEPKFNRALRERAIVLNCAFENASFLSIEEKIKKGDDGFLALFQGGVSLLFDRLANHVFKNMHTELVICGETVEFSSFEAQSEDVTLYASGTVNESGDFGINAKIFFSPKITESLPEELKAMLTEESKGYLSYYLHIESGQDKSSLKLESDRFRLNFEQLENR